MFLSLYEDLLKVNAVPIDYFIYVDIDVSTSLARTEKRDKRIFDTETKKFFTLMQKKLKNYCINYCKNNNVKLLILDGNDSIIENIIKIKNFVPELQFINNIKS